MSRLPDPLVELAPGYRISPLVNGCWQLAADHREVRGDRQQVLAGLLARAEAGLTTFDGADIYTGVESLLGELGRLCRQRGLEIQIHTKCVPDRASLAHLRRRDVASLVHRSLRRLGVERLDLVQLHWWDFSIPGWLEAAGWLQELQRVGKIRLLGATNFDVPRLADILDAGIPLVSHQVQYSLFDRRPEGGMADLCQRYGLRLLTYGTLAGGFLTDAYWHQPPPAEPANRSLVKYRLILDEVGGWDHLQTLLAVLRQIAAKHDVPTSTVALRWVLGRPAVAGLLIGTRGAAHLQSTLEVLRLGLDEEDLARLDAALHPSPAGDVYELERVPAGRHAAILRTDLNRKGESHV